MIDFDRFLNLVYYWAVSRLHDVKDRKKFDRDLRRAPASSVDPTIASAEYVPDWWRGDDVAGQQGLAVARSFGFNVDLSAVSG